MNCAGHVRRQHSRAWPAANSAIRLAILGISQSTMASSKCLTIGYGKAKSFGCRYQAEALIRTDRMSNSGFWWNHFDLEAIARDIGLHYPIANAMSRTKRLILGAYGGLIRRSSEPYLKEPSLGGLRCGQANQVCTDEWGNVLFRSVLHPLR